MVVFLGLGIALTFRSFAEKQQEMATASPATPHQRVRGPGGKPNSKPAAIAGAAAA